MVENVCNLNWLPINRENKLSIFSFDYKGFRFYGCVIILKDNNLYVNFPSREDDRFKNYYYIPDADKKKVFTDFVLDKYREQESAGKAEENDFEITNVHIKHLAGENRVAIASFKLDDIFIVKELTILNIKDRLVVVYPEVYVGNRGKRQGVMHPLSERVRLKVEEEVLAEYKAQRP